MRCCGNVDLEAVYQESAPGCNLNERAKQDLDRQDTPGHLAARLGLAGVLLALLEHGFKVNSKNSEKKTCLHIAIESENSVWTIFCSSYYLSIQIALIDSVFSNWVILSKKCKSYFFLET